MLRLSLVLALIASPVILPAVQEVITVPSVLSQDDTTHIKSSRLPLLQRLIEKGNWSEIARQVKKGHGITLRDLQMLSLSNTGTPFFRAVLATKNILSLNEKTGLSLNVVFPIALFAETSMKDETDKGRYFWSSSRFGRELQVDQANKHLFIHLGTHGVKPVGIGRMKVVTKTIFYDRLHPEVMARGVSESGCKREMYAMRHLKGLPHVLEAQALMRHKDPKTGKKIATIITRIMRPGSLQSILDNKAWKLTFKERVGIACDIMAGISGMQSKKFAHCDLGARNYFVKIKGKKPGHREIQAYVADFGRTIPIKTAKDAPVQGNSRYTPPEAIFREKMRGKDYFQSDLFAVGCVFWRLYFGELPGWSMSDYFNNEAYAKKARHRAKIYHINAIRGHYSDKLKTSSAKKGKTPLREGFLKVILQMTDPSPKARGQAVEIHSTLCELLGRPVPKVKNDISKKSDHKDSENSKRHGGKKK